MTFALIAFHLAVLVAVAGLLVFGAVNDARHYKIPNAVAAALIALFPVYVLTAPRDMAWTLNLTIFALLLVTGFGLYMGKLAGAGDAKLLAAMGLWAGPHLVALFLIVTGLAGGVLALVVAARTFLRSRTVPEAAAVGHTPIPYGIAIATGGMAVVLRLALPLLFPE